MPECEHLVNCGFFRKYQGTRNIACEGFIASYCKGPSMDQCARKKHRKKHGVPPCDDMMPTGHMLKEGLVQRSR